MSAKELEDFARERDERVEELEEENRLLRAEAADNEYYVERGELYDSAPEGLEEAHNRIRVLEDALEWQKRATREARYTMPPRMGSSRSRPNWPDKPNNRLDKARKALVEALLELGVIHATCR